MDIKELWSDSIVEVYISVNKYTKIDENMKQELSDLLQVLKVSIRQPLWDYDTETIDAIIDSVLITDFVAKVNIVDTNIYIIAGRVIENLMKQEDQLYHKEDIFIMNDAYTRGHCERVSCYSVLIAVKMNLDKHDVEILEYAAALHDIGKARFSRSSIVFAYLLVNYTVQLTAVASFSSALKNAMDDINTNYINKVAMFAVRLGRDSNGFVRTIIFEQK